MVEAIVRAAAGASDIGAVRGLFRAYGEHLANNPIGAASIRIENFEAEITDLPEPYLLLLLATVEEEPAGCVALKPLARNAERACELKRLWVSPAFRGHRLGRRLLQAAIEHARRLGCMALYLDTVPAAMPEANRLYEALGFEQVARYNGNPVAGVAFFRLTLI